MLRDKKGGNKMSKLGKRRKQWTEEGKKNHIAYLLIKNCKPIAVEPYEKGERKRDERDKV